MAVLRGHPGTRRGLAALLPILASACVLRGAGGVNVFRQATGRADHEVFVHYEFKEYSYSQIAASPQALSKLAATIDILVIESAEENEVIVEMTGLHSTLLPLYWSDERQELEWRHRGGPTPFTPMSYHDFRLPYDTIATRARSGHCFVLRSCTPSLSTTWVVVRPEFCDQDMPVIIEERVATRGSFRVGDSYYMLSELPDLQLKAIITARSLDMLSYPGRLVTIDSAAENLALAAALSDAGIERAFTGGTYVKRPEDGHIRWVWRSPTDSTRAPRRLIDLGPCTVAAGAFVNLTAAALNFACTFPSLRENFAHILLTTSGAWEAFDQRNVLFTAGAHYIVEFPIQRNWTAETLVFRDKAYRLVGLDTQLDEAKALVGNATFEHFPGLQLKGHLPAVGSFAENMLLGRFIKENTPHSCVTSRWRFWAPSEHHGEAAVWGQDAGVLAGVGFLPRKFASGFTPPRTFFEGLNECLSISHHIWRLANCTLPAVAVAQFDLHFYKGAYYREEPNIQVGWYGAVQLAKKAVAIGGTQRGDLIEMREPADRLFLDYLFQRTDINTLPLAYYYDPQQLSFLHIRDKSLLTGPLGRASFVIADDRFGVGGGGVSGAQLKACSSFRRSNERIEALDCLFDLRPLVLAYRDKNDTIPDIGGFGELDFCVDNPELLRCDCTIKTSIECLGLGLVRPPSISQEVSKAVLISNAFITLRGADWAAYDHVRELVLRSNNIEAAEAGFFDTGFRNLETLELEVNRLSEVPELSRLPSLVNLDLGSNFITGVPRGRLPVSLQELYLQRNMITSIEPGVFEELTALTLLDLSANLITAFPAVTMQHLLDSNVNFRGNDNPCFDEPDRLRSCNPQVVLLPGVFSTTATPAGPPGSSSSGVSPALVAGVVVAVLLVLAVVAVAVRRRQADKGRVTAAHMQLGEGGAVPMQVNALHAAEQWDNRVIQFLPEHIEFGKQLGSGAFGNVHRGRIVQRKQRLDVAVKSLNEAYSIDREAQRLFLREARIMAGLQHDNVVRLHGICMTPAPLIVLEYMSNSDLQSYLREHNTRLSAVRLHGFCRDVASGMAYLQSKNIVHRDLAARNVLLNEELVAKLADLGLARDLQDEDYYRKISNDPLPVRWMAPESLSDRLYVLKTDVWSYAVTVWEIYSLGETPFPQLSTAQVLRVVLSGTTPLECPTLCPPSTYKVMLECWRFDPPQRPDFVDIGLSLASHTPALDLEPTGADAAEDETSI